MAMIPGSADAHRDLVQACTDYLTCCHAWVFKVAGGFFQRPGIPDILAGMPAQDAAGRTICALVAVECKTGKATLRPSQVREKAAMEAAGVVYVLCRQPEDLEEALLAAGLITTPLLQRRTS